MCTRLSSTRSSGSDGLVAGERARSSRTRSSGSARSTARARAQSPAPRPWSRSASMTPVDVVDRALHGGRPQFAGRAVCVYFRAAAAAAQTARWGAKRRVEHADPGPPELVALLRRILHQGFASVVLASLDHAVQQRQQHRILGGKVEVEGWPGISPRPWPGRRQKYPQAGVLRAGVRLFPGSPAHGRRRRAGCRGGRGRGRAWLAVARR